MTEYYEDKLKNEEWWDKLTYEERYKCIQIVTYETHELPLFNKNNETYNW